MSPKNQHEKLKYNLIMLIYLVYKILKLRIWQVHSPHILLRRANAFFLVRCTLLLKIFTNSSKFDWL